jgi:gas vesicle protein
MMKVGKYEVAESKSSVGTAVTFLMIGIGAGALVALLLAPKTGKQMRKELRRRIDDARDSIEDWSDDARDRIQDAKEKLQDAVERGSDWAEDLRDTARERSKPLRAALRRD